MSLYEPLSASIISLSPFFFFSFEAPFPLAWGHALNAKTHDETNLQKLSVSLSLLEPPRNVTNRTTLAIMRWLALKEKKWV
jgi:hypothetical protein